MNNHFIEILKSYIKLNDENEVLKQNTILKQEAKSILSQNFIELNDFYIDYVRDIFMLSEFGEFCFDILLYNAIVPEFYKVFQWLQNDLKKTGPTFSLMISLYYGNMDMDLKQQLHYQSQETEILNYIAIENSKNVLELNKRIKEFIRYHDLKNIEETNFFYNIFPTENENYVGHFINYAKIFEDNNCKNNCRGNCNIIYISGKKDTGRRESVKRFAYKNQKVVTMVDLDKLTETNQLMEDVHQIILEIKLMNSLPCIINVKDYIKTVRIIIKALKTITKVIFVCIEDKKLKLDDDVTSVTINLPELTMRESVTLWRKYLQKENILDSIDIDEMAGKYHFTPKQIINTVKEAVCLAKLEDGYITNEILDQAAYMQTEHSLEKRAIKIRQSYQWNDLVLPDSQKNMLLMACDYIKYKKKVYCEWDMESKISYGMGLSMIFTGAPGTGKTMSAQVIAKELGLEIYKIDLSGVISKYIGETEKNLNYIFEEAKNCQGILFFDEADVLFSKRTEVKDSNDKYSNMEAAFMLQKMEEYDGVVILATNYQQNIDEAFKRRIKFVIDFPFPDKTYRYELWKHIIPEKMPIEADVDYEFLADRFELSGSNIKNVILAAAFRAAAENSQVKMKHFLNAVIQEFAKSGKTVTREDLGQYYVLL